MLRVAQRRCAAVAAAATPDALSAATHTQSPTRKTLQETVAAVFRSPSYLRHAPPRLYVTASHDQGIRPNACGRHTTQVVDVSRAVSLEAPLHTDSVYLLTSTSMADVDFKDTAAQSQVLVGLPCVRHVDAVQRFCDLHGPSLQNVHHIVLPGEVSPTQSLLIQTLLQQLPHVRVVCNDYGQALLTNPAFHDGVRRAMLENAPSVALELLRFAELPPERVSAVKDGDVVAVDVPKDETPTIESVKAAPARTLRVLAVQSEAQVRRRKAQQQSHHPSYFTNQRLFFYDDVFHALFVGHTLHRLPWLPVVLKEAMRELVLPMPPPLALQHPMGRPSVLSDTWRVQETAAEMVEALRRTPELEQMLCGSYGELSGNLEDCIAQVEQSSDALERLRSRLARRLATDTSRDVHRWSTALLKRIVEEVVCVQTAREPTSPETQAQFLSWATQEGDWGRLARCLTHAAMVLPPSEMPAEEPAGVTPTTSHRPDANERSAAGHRDGHATADAQRSETPLEGASGVDLLVAVLEKKGLQGLNRTVRKETIDVQVFLAMSESDLKAVFKTTFGLTKRLTLLQEELRKSI